MVNDVTATTSKHEYAPDSPHRSSVLVQPLPVAPVLGCAGPWLGARVSADPRPPPPPPPPSCSRRGEAATAVAAAVAAEMCAPDYPLARSRRFPVRR